METTTGSVVLLLVLFLTMEFNMSNGYSNMSSKEREHQALLKFKKRLTDHSNQLSSWIGEDHCTWRGVGCNQKTGHVIKLNLRNPLSFHMAGRYDSYDYSTSCLGGEINPSLLELKYLNYLDLSMNNFTDIQIPKFFGSLAKLRYLNLSGAGFQGMVPHHLGNLSSLLYLDLSVKVMSPFFQSLNTDNLNWISPLSSLQHLDLSWIHIEATDWLYAINRLPSLLELHLNYCGLSNIPPLSYINFTFLASLDLEGNIMNSTIPHWLFNLSSLVYLNLGGSSFHGSISDDIGNMTSLTDLYLKENEFEGEIPSTMKNLCNLRSLNLAANKFSGEISVILEGLFGCVGNNLLNLVLEVNEFHGQIPESLGQLSNLEVFSISQNSLNGTISELHFAKLKRLTELKMSSNSLVLNLSSTWVPPFQLETLDMESCKLGPQFPPWLKTQRNISYLDLSSTSISDTIPDWFQDLSIFFHYLDLSSNQIHGEIQNFLNFRNRTEMKKLYLNDNLLSGHIPQNIGNMIPELDDLSLARNQLTGGIPLSLCKMDNLQHLELSKNHLSGQLPQCWKQLTSLYWIDLSYNNLSGHLPSSMGSQTWVYLSLSNNNFYGELPFDLKKCTSLTVLDLGENGFSGKIPQWIGESFSLLQILNLGSNVFDGNIPQQLCNLAHLQLLDLSHNNLSRTIPHCFANFSAMQWPENIGPGQVYYNRMHMSVDTKGRELEYTFNLRFVVSLDLSSNKLTGEVPEELTNLKEMVFLDISGNHLTGRIPEKIGNLNLLESLDFSRNQLSGPIPPSLSTLSFLSYLNLSFNNLSGPILMGNQLQTLDDPSIYVGNPELCGRPLPKKCKRDDSSDVPVPVGVDKSNGEDNLLWFYTGLGPGFACGFLAFLGILLFKKTWRYTYFRLLESIHNKLFL